MNLINNKYNHKHFNNNIKVAVKQFTHAINYFIKQTYFGKYGKNKSLNIH